MGISDIFSYLSYKKYLNDTIKSRPAGGHGYRTKLANACGCRLSYITEVLNRSGNFNLEQAEALNQFLGHSSEESEYFLLLVNFERAGTDLLQKRLRAQIDRFRVKRLTLKDRAIVKTELRKDDQATYYSSWLYAAVHMLASLDQLKTRDALAEHLRIPKDIVADVLDFLTRIGLLQNDRGIYKIATGRIFLGNDSPNVIKHHTNWRLRAIEALDRGIKTNMHYTSIFSIQAQDLIVAKEILAKAIDGFSKIVHDSKNDEEVHVFNLDVFKI